MDRRWCNYWPSLHPQSHSSSASSFLFLYICSLCSAVLVGIPLPMQMLSFFSCIVVIQDLLVQSLDSFFVVLCGPSLAWLSLSTAQQNPSLSPRLPKAKANLSLRLWPQHYSHDMLFTGKQWITISWSENVHNMFPYHCWVEFSLILALMIKIA